MFEYLYSIINDTQSSLLNHSKLSSEISNSSIGQVPSEVTSNDDSLKISFDLELSSSQETTLSAIVSSHDGEPDPEEVIPSQVEIVNETPPSPFANKVIGVKKVFSRVTGKSFPVTTGNNTLTFTIPYPHVKINGVEIIGCSLGDKLTFKVLDSSSGTYTTVPNLELNTFGIDVYMCEGKYERLSNYDADLYQGMQVQVEYTSTSNKTAYINYIIHELKD